MGNNCKKCCYSDENKNNEFDTSPGECTTDVNATLAVDETDLDLKEKFLVNQKNQIPILTHSTEDDVNSKKKKKIIKKKILVKKQTSPIKEFKESISLPLEEEPILKENSENFRLFLNLKNLSGQKKNQEFSLKIFISEKEGDFSLLGETQKKKRESNIEFNDLFRFAYNFGKTIILKIQVESKTNTTDYLINLDTIVSENLSIFSLPIQFEKSVQVDVNKDYIKLNKVLDKSQKIEFNFERNKKIDYELGIFIEFNYVALSYLAKKMYYNVSYQKRSEGILKEIYRSNERYGKNPIFFNPCYINIQFLEKNFPLFLNFYDKHEFLGQIILTKFELESLFRREIHTQLLDKNNKKIANIKINLKKIAKHRFIDYLTHGLDINFAIGIDYTSSNRDPMKVNSLHTLKGIGKNQYENAIRACGRILSNYDKSSNFPVYGFGGIPKGKNLISHCFNVNGLSNPKIKGLENVIKTYKESLKIVKLLGPTKFNILIKGVIEEIIKTKNQLKEQERKSERKVQKVERYRLY